MKMDTTMSSLLQSLVHEDMVGLCRHPADPFRAREKGKTSWPLRKRMRKYFDTLLRSGMPASFSLVMRSP